MKPVSVNWFNVVRYAWFVALCMLLGVMLYWRVYHAPVIRGEPEHLVGRIQSRRDYLREARRIVGGLGNPAADTLARRYAIASDTRPSTQPNPNPTRARAAGAMEAAPLRVDGLEPDNAETVRRSDISIGIGDEKTFQLDESLHKYPTIADWSNKTSGSYKGIRWSLIRASKPRIIIAKDVLSDEECAQIVAVANASLARSEIVHPPGQSGINVVRTSFGMFLNSQDQLLPANQKIRRIVSALMGVREVNIEATQVLRYTEGQYYLPHPDYFAKGSEHLSRGGQRFATLLFWLNDVPSGGETRFPSVDVAVSPKKGSGIMFYSMDANGVEDPNSYHEAIPPTNGAVKWVAISWVRQHEFH